MEMLAAYFLVGFYITAFALFDYVGFNLVRDREKWKMDVYRAIQHAVLVTMAYHLVLILSWGAGIAFAILWWTWWADGLYYIFYDSLRWFGEGEAWGSEVVGNRVTWAWWTPFGLWIWAVFGTRSTVSTYKELMKQLIVGMLLALLSIYLF